MNKKRNGEKSRVFDLKPITNEKDVFCKKIIKLKENERS